MSESSKQIDKSKNGKLELLRFIICGVVAALTDYLVSQLIVLLLGDKLSGTWVIVISTGIGFIVSVIVNYLISTYWVYQNVDKNVKTKSGKFITIFVLLSLAAMGLSILAMYLCNLFVIHVVGHDSIIDLSVMGLIKEYGWGFLGQSIFWDYIVSFGVKTVTGFVFNYFTRKKILYKAPK